MFVDDLIKLITPGLYRIGDLGVPVFLVDSHSPVIIDTGYSFTGELYVKAIKKILGKREPRWCLITHTHFDHVGAAGYFKKFFPGMTIAASELAMQIACKQKAIDHIGKLNLFAENVFPRNFLSANTPFLPFQIETILSEGNILDIGKSLNISVLETPGHTRDSLSFFINKGKILFTGDSGGIHHTGGYIFYDFLSGCKPYIKSLDKICKTGADVICQGHYNAITGPLADQYLKELIPGCLGFIKFVSSIIDEQNGDIKASMNIIKSLEYDVLDEPKQPEPAYLINLEARIKSALSFVS